jgi:membrane-associated phospholipid phosphatase
MERHQCRRARQRGPSETREVGLVANSYFDPLGVVIGRPPAHPGQSARDQEVTRRIDHYVRSTPEPVELPIYWTATNVEHSLELGEWSGASSVPPSRSGCAIPAMCPAAKTNTPVADSRLPQTPTDIAGGAILTAAGTTAFAVLARRAAAGTVSAQEERSFRLVNGLPNGILGPVWLVMQGGSLAAVGAAALAVQSHSRSTATGLAVAGTTAWALARFTKPLVGRGRPADHLGRVTVRGAKQSGLGFPSGHAAVAAALAVVGSRGLANHRISASVLVAGVGAARQYVGAHLPLDVAGGIALGATVGAVTNLTLDGLKDAARRRNRQHSARRR